jgi:conjugal transfer pilus assembly protein TraB
LQAEPGDEDGEHEQHEPVRVAGAVKGVGSTLDRLANYFMDMAEEMFPVIEIDAGRGIEFALDRGVTLRLAQGRR